MKTIYSLFTLILCSTFATAQTTLISDEDHRIMMNNFSENLNTVLLTECPQGMEINLYKKKIVNGEIQLSNTAKSSINNYAASLITYAQ